VRGRGVGPCVAERSETGFPIGDRGERVQKVACRSRQPVEPCDHHDLAGLDAGEQAAKLCAVGLGSARHFAEHLFASGLGELAHLRLDALAVCRDAGVTVFHARDYAADLNAMFSVW
jgi:hypothetical protein